MGLITSEIWANRSQFWSDLECCDWFEFRSDTFKNDDEAFEALKEVQEEKGPRSILLTTRLKRDGGLLDDQDASGRIHFWQKAANQNLYDWIDIELEEPDLMVEFIDSKPSHIKVLCSHHNFESGHTISELNFFAAKAKTLGADGLKFALMFQEEKEEKDLYEFIMSDLPIELYAAFGMGPRGKSSRVLGPLLGAPLTYGYAGDKESAPGQWPLKKLREALDMFSKMDLSVDELLKAL